MSTFQAFWSLPKLGGNATGFATNKAANGVVLDYSTTVTAGNNSSGLGITITPQYSGQFFVGVWGWCSNNTAGDGCLAFIIRNTTGIPAKDTLGLGTAVPGGNQVTSSLANAQCPLGMAAIDPLWVPQTGLTLGVPIFYWLAFVAVTGGTATLKGSYFSIAAWEI